MQAKNKIKKILFALILIISLSCIFPSFYAYAEGGETLYLGGFPAGFILNTQNVEVVGLCDISTENGNACPAREAGLQCGDIIKNLNDVNITSAEILNKTVNESFNRFILSVKRGEEVFETEIKPIKDEKSGKNKLGLLVKDSLNGIGTVTYIDKSNNSFGSLGHPVSDLNGELIEINGGSLYGCSIYDVKRGVRGNPGELKGVFDNGYMLGYVTKNTNCGIFGKISNEFEVDKLKKVTKGSAQSATIGKAKIYSTLNGNVGEEYDISIVKIDSTNSENKNFVIKINDKRLLERSGGIVQGMSGSPIVQNGQLIGAVTHVFVNDPTRGYGIAIEKMTSSY